LPLEHRRQLYQWLRAPHASSPQRLLTSKVGNHDLSD
jgi:hypothetical protein